ncbi:hypothetical protein HCJ76_04175 [Streptomyces sp. MC1]|uniref:hypothetical protein n=1 Tax=Streptomyces TaxID=1883 RepID=UPI00131D9DF9|nr:MULTISPECIES: hypothetical protein [unclassified Streptomyces]MBG7697313.1 hypothetical protein [Streptomyces sp. MC1]
MTSDAYELIDDWESIWQGYFLGEHDETLLDCVERLDRARSARPYDPDVTAFYTLGLVWTHGHAMHDAEPEVARRVVAALSAVASDPALAQAACDHAGHPCDEDLYTHLESFEMLLSLLAGSSDYTWEDMDTKGGDPDPGSGWRCPRNVAGFARTAVGEIERYRK